MALTPLALAAEQRSFNPRDARRRLGQVRQFDFNPDDVAMEIDFGREVAAHLLGRYGLLEDDLLQRYVMQIGRSQIGYVNRPELEFYFAVLDTDQVNAFAAPGGYVFITRGAIEQMEDEAELASVIAHEIIHVSERHIVNELDLRAGEGGMVSGLSRILGGSGDPARAAFAQAVDQALDILLEDGLSEQDEFEADRYGTFLAAQIGYDPLALNRYLRRISEYGGESVISGWASTHPSFERRIAELDTFIADAGLSASELPRLRERYLEHVAR
ncbi:M48 family metalloprotease [Halorhodospira halochloris]|uniref:M48 family metalloprotease n=1 Tax=Halorhodospira halochloris TaxID=1052 RepID=UPI001EE8F79A|nr:M48 family metalloprotease [Halorhodospira halochloris]